MADLELSAPAQFAERRPLWARLWPAGSVLADIVSGELAPRMRGRAVVELGCGLGAVGIAAARAGGTVTMTDRDPDALAVAGANARANGVAPRFHVLDWGRVPEAGVGAFDVVLGSDITYAADELAPLLGAVEALLAPGGEAWLADPDRLRLPALVAAAARAGLSVELVRTIVDPPPLPTSDDSETRPVHVYRLWRV